MSERRWLGLAAACLLLVLCAAAARAGERNYWYFDKGHFENTSGNQWTEKKEDETIRFVETTRTEAYVELYDKDRDVTVRLYADRSEAKGPGTGFKFVKRFDGTWGGAPETKAPNNSPPPAPKVLAVERRLSWPGRDHFFTSFSGDGRLCAAFGGDAWRVWTVETGALVSQAAELPDTVSARFLPDGKQLFSSHTDGTFRRWDLATGKQVAQLQGPAAWNLISGITSDGARFCFNGPQAVYVWNLKMGKELFRVEPAEADAVLLASYPLSPDGKRLLVVDLLKPAGGIVVRIFDVATGNRLLSVKSKFGAPDGQAWGENGRHIYLNAGDSDLKASVLVCMRTDTGEVVSKVRLVPDPTSSYGRGFSPNNRFFGVQYPDQRLIHLYDVRSGNLVGTASAAITPFSLSFTPDSRFMATGSQGEVIIYRLPEPPAEQEKPLLRQPDRQP